MILEVVEDSETGLKAALAVVRGEGLSFGGTRFSCHSSPEEVLELALCMEAKLRPHRAEIGGAKAGFFCSPQDPRLPQLLEKAAAQWRPLLQERVVLGKDMGASDTTMAKLYAAVGLPQLGPLRDPSAPAWLRDFPGYRQHMTGQGVCWALKEVHEGCMEGVRVAIQGAGAVGLGSAVRLLREGAQIVAISDIEHTVLLQKDLHEDELLGLVTRGRLRTKGGAVRELGPREQLFHEEADALVLAASSYSVDAPQAEGLSAGCVVEGSNFGLTPGAREVVALRGLTVVPDVMASSASAAMVAHQLFARGRAAPAELWANIEACIRREVRQGLKHWRECGESLRSRAFRKAGIEQSQRSL